MNLVHLIYYLSAGLGIKPQYFFSTNQSDISQFKHSFPHFRLHLIQAKLYQYLKTANKRCENRANSERFRVSLFKIMSFFFIHKKYYISY